MHSPSPTTRGALILALLLPLLVAGATVARAQAEVPFEPVTDEMLRSPAPGDWLTWRRTLDGWGYSPLDQIDRDNVGELRLVWTRALRPGSQQGTPLAYGGVLYMPNPADVIQAIDAVTGDLRWEHQRERPDDLDEYLPAGGLLDNNRNIAIYGNLNHRHQRRRLRLRPRRRHRRARLGDAHPRLSDESRPPDLRPHRREREDLLGPRMPAEGRARRLRHHRPRRRDRRRALAPPDDTRPRRAGGRDLGRRPVRGAAARRRLDGAELRPGAEPGLHRHVGHVAGAQVPPRRHGEQAPLPQLHARPRRRHGRDPLVLPAPERPLGPRPPLRAVAGRHPGRAGSGRRELDQPAARAGRGAAGGDRHPGQDRRRLHARPRDRRVPVGHADHHAERHRRDRRRDGSGDGERRARLHGRGTGGAGCPHASGGKDWEAGAYSPRTNTMYYPLRNVCARMLATTEGGGSVEVYALVWRGQIAPGTDQVGSVYAISAETGRTVWQHDQRAATMSLVATGGGLVFGGDVNGRFRAFDDETGEVLWEINLGSSVSGFPITYAVDGRQYVAVSTGTPRFLDLTPELRPSTGNNLFVFALP